MSGVPRWDEQMKACISSKGVSGICIEVGVSQWVVESLRWREEVGRRRAVVEVNQMERPALLRRKLASPMSPGSSNPWGSGPCSTIHTVTASLFFASIVRCSLFLLQNKSSHSASAEDLLL